jgi:phosphoribosylformylglycinamidine synthase I
MKAAVIQFPGSNCDQDCLRILNQCGFDARYVWHKDSDLGDAELIVVPGGFSFGDYLRCGAIARFSPIMQSVKEAAAKGRLVLGICNGFQILCEARLLPGALVRNRSLHFRCEHVWLRVEQTNSAFTRNFTPGQVIRIPIAHGEGNYRADEHVLRELEDEGRVLVRYVDASGKPADEANPNGSMNNIAGICNRERNVFGLMPHPERASEPILGSSDGRIFFESILGVPSNEHTFHHA